MSATIASISGADCTKIVNSCPATCTTGGAVRSSMTNRSAIDSGSKIFMFRGMAQSIISGHPIPGHDRLRLRFRDPHEFEQRVQIAIIRYDNICAGLNQPLTLPGVDPCTMLLVAGDSDRDAAGPLDLLDFDVAVAEADELARFQFQLADQPFDHHLLREILIIVDGAVDVRAEEAVEREGPHFVLDEDQIGAACQVQRALPGRKLFE